MFETLKNAFKVKEIRHKIYWTLLFLLIYRIGCFIPVPGVGTELLNNNVTGQASYLNIMSMMTGGALANGTLFAMGIGPYINASIIMQLLAVAIPPLERLSKQGEEGRRLPVHRNTRSRRQRLLCRRNPPLHRMPERKQDSHFSHR